MAAAEVKVDLNEAYAGGLIEVTGQSDPAEDGSVVVTITVTPNEGYYIAKEDILVVPTLPSSLPTTRDGAPVVANKLELNGDDPENLSDKRDYTFTLGAGLGAWVKEANFHQVVADNDISGDKESAVTWTFDAETKAMVITGTGITADFGGEGTDPWAAVRDQIVSVVVEKGITSLGANIFSGCTSLTSVRIDNAEQVLKIGADAIPANEGLKISVPANLLNEYQITDGWKGLGIGSEDAVAMSGIVFGASNEYDAFVSNQSIMVPSVLKAYTITGINSDGLVLSEVDVIPTGTPVLLYNSMSLADTEFFSAATEDMRGSQSLLKVAPEGGQEVKLGEVYLLYNDVFYYSQAGTIPQGEIYLANPSPEKTRGFYSISSDGTTGIDTLRLQVEGQSVWYSLDGRRLPSMPTSKGIYIKDGKKVIIR